MVSSRSGGPKATAQAFQAVKFATLSPRTLSTPVNAGVQLVVTPNGEPLPQQPQIDNALVKALARAHRWKRLLEASEHSNRTELAVAEKINRSYVSRVLRLTLLAPEIVEAILDGKQGRS